MADIFKQARDAITASLVEYFASSPGAYWQGGKSGQELWTLNPTRGDSAIGSFSITETGQWYDHATKEGGDLIALIVEMRGCTKKQAAEEIIRASGGIVQDKPAMKPAAKPKKDKPAPQVPAPEIALKSLNIAISAAWVIERHGKPIKGWTYRTAEGGVAFCVSRHEKPDGSKDVLPWYYGQDNNWHPGQAFEHGRPLYRLDILANADRGTPVLVVEGEKCASIDVPGYIVTTWSGGTAAVDRTDWSPLEGREVIIWPDADNQLNKQKTAVLPWPDQPGIKAALAIANRLPGAKILDVKSKAATHPGWDIADAVADGVDPVAFIAGALPRESDENAGDAGEFVCLGHDQTHHWFLRRGVRVPYKIAIGSFNASKIGSLAILSYWAAMGHTNDQGSIKVASAQDYIEGMSFGVGQYRPERIRGAGVWRDADGFIINDGSKLIKTNGEVIAYDKQAGRHHYISSSVEFGAMHEHAAEASEGVVLAKLFEAQGWANPAQASLAMGWALIAPFGGILRWRPHAWITGRRGTGKSWVLSDLIAPLCGPFAHIGSGKDSEAGLRRSLDMDARPVILDEMEPKGQRAAERVSAILDLARNASSDGSGYITLAAPDGGTQRFVVRSCFCFGSIQTPDEGAAIASRITMLELRPVADQQAKFTASAALYAECMDDPGRFRRRTFRALSRIQRDIEYLRTDQRGLFGEQRRADQYAPMLAAAWAAQSDESIQASAGLTWLAELSPYLGPDQDQGADDEEAVINHLLGAHVKTDDNRTRTVAELLQDGYCADSTVATAREVLERYGIRVYSGGLAIKAKGDQLRTLLRDTPYATGYGAQIKRHRLAIDDSTHQVRMAGGHAQCYVLDWHRFRAEYIDERTAMLLPDDPPF
jgi:putative DNA primase/helicase